MSSDPIIPIYLELTPEQEQILSENHLSIANILREENIQGQVTYGTLPADEGEVARSMDVVLIILASGVSAYLIGAAVARVIELIQNRPQVVEYTELQVVRDAKGNPVLDENGKPRLIREKNYKLLQPRATNTEKELEFRIPGIVLKINDRSRGMKPPNKKE